jgi:hypothetical protein
LFLKTVKANILANIPANIGTSFLPENTGANPTTSEFSSTTAAL